MLIFPCRESFIDIEEINYIQMYIYFFTFTYYILINNDINLSFIVRDLE